MAKVKRLDRFRSIMAYLEQAGQDGVLKSHMRDVGLAPADWEAWLQLIQEIKASPEIEIDTVPIGVSKKHKITRYRLKKIVDEQVPTFMITEEEVDMLRKIRARKKLDAEKEKEDLIYDF